MLAPKFAWKDRWWRWWMQRLPCQDRLELTHRNVYLLPTAAGLVWGATLLALLIGSINYQLNLGYLLTFLLLGCAAAGTHLAHANLRGLVLTAPPGTGVFAGQTATVPLEVHNPSRRARWGLGLRWHPSHQPDPTRWCDVPAHDHCRLTLDLTAPTRGRWPLPPVLIETRFPLGTFRVWSWWRPAGHVLVYPTPESPCPPLARSAAHTAPSAPRPTVPAPTLDDTDGVRPYRAGDSMRHIVWKKVAKRASANRNTWISRDRPPPPSGPPLWLDDAQCGLRDPEARLSRLCAWVLQAEQEGRDYGLRLAGVDIAPAHGAAHRQRCLEALACA